MKIFILDDDRFFGRYIENALATEQRKVTYFQSEADCLDSMVQKPNVLILDHKLENTDGFEIIEEVKRRNKNHTYILYLSAQETVHVTLKAFQYGVFEYLEKGSQTIDNLNDALNKIQSLTNNFTIPLDMDEYRESKYR